MPKIRKKTSKRPTLRKQYSVQKKVKEHHRKIKKESKKLSKLGLRPKRMKKQPGVPNLFPYKEEMLESLERKQAMDKEMAASLKGLRDAKKMLPTGTLENYRSVVSHRIVIVKNSDMGQGKLDTLTNWISRLPDLTCSSEADCNV